MLYKEDWDEAKDRLVQWWNGAYFGRCAIGVKAPREQPPDVPPPSPAQTPEQRWLDLACQAYQFALDAVRLTERRDHPDLSPEALAWRVTRRMQGDRSLGKEFVD